MIVDEHITDYLHSLIKEDSHQELCHIEEEARNQHVPIVKPETKELLKILVLLKRPKRFWKSGRQ